MITEHELNQRLLAVFPDAQITIRDLTGTQDHYHVDMVSTAFVGLSPIARHRKVYAVFNDVVGGALHALSLNTKAPNE